MFECSAAVVQADVAAALQKNPELIQQIDIIIYTLSIYLSNHLYLQVFECSAAVVQADVAAALKKNPELIQQICELTAVTVADITEDSLLLYGPVEHIHKAKYLMQQVRANSQAPRVLHIWGLPHKTCLTDFKLV